MANSKTNKDSCARFLDFISREGASVDWAQGASAGRDSNFRKVERAKCAAELMAAKERKEHKNILTTDKHQ